MSNFSKRGLRQVKIDKDRLVKKHTKGFWQSIAKINKVVEELQKLDVEVTEDNVNELSKPILGRDLDSMEQFMVLGKLFEVTNET